MMYFYNTCNSAVKLRVVFFNKRFIFISGYQKVNKPGKSIMITAPFL